MSLTRRDVIKAGVFAGAALSLPLSRVVSGQSALDNRLPASKLPKPFTIPFGIPPVAVPFRTDATTDYYAMTMRATPLEVIPGFKTMFFAYEGSVPGPTIRVNQGRQAVVRHIIAAEGAPHARVRAMDVRAPSWLGVAARVRRLRQ